LAVVGEAHILVRAVTTQVKKDIQSGLKGLKGQGTDSGEEFGKGFGQGLAGQMTQAQKSFSSLMRRGYALQAGLGAVAGSVGALVGGLASLGGAAVVAGSSITVLLNGMVALKVATTVGGMALKGVSQAVSAAGSSAGGAGDSVEDLKDKLEQLRLEARKAGIGQKQAALDFEKAKLSFERTADLPAGDLRRRQAAIDLEEAKLNLDNAKQANKDAKEALKEGPKSEAGADPYAGLTKTQKEFAQYLVTIQSKMVLLREAAASSFLPELQSQLQSFIANGYMGTLVKSFTYLSEGLAKFTSDFSRSFISTGNMRLLAEVFRNVTTSLAGFGTVAGNALKGFLYYLKNTNPLLNRFVVFLQQKTGQFATDQKNNASSIQAFFKKAGDIAADFGTIFTNLSDRFKQFLGNTTGPGSGGQMMLDWLKDITGNFRNFDQNVENAISRKYFAESSANLKIMLESFSGLFRFLLKLGGNPAVGQFWENLQAGQGALAQLVTNSAEAGPGLANILVSVTKILAALSDSAQVLAFFETLDFIFNAIATMLKDMKPILDSFGPLIGTLSALGLVFLGFKKAGIIIGGFILLALKPLLFLLGGVIPAAGKAGVAVGLFSAATQTALAGISRAIFAVPVVGWLLGVVAALTAAGTAFSMWSADSARKTETATRALAKGGASVKEFWAEANKGSTWKTSADYWNSFNGGITGAIDKLRQGQEAQRAGWGWMNDPALQETAGRFERLGAGISELVKKEGLPAASAALLEFSKLEKITSADTVVAYEEMDLLREQVRGYAEDLEVTVTNLDGTYNAQKEYNFLMEETGFKAKAAALEQERFNTLIANAVNSFIDINAPLQQNEREVMAWAKSHAKYNKIAGDSWKDYYEEFENTGFSLDYYLRKVQVQLDSAADYGANLRVASTKLSKGAFEALAGMGKEGVDLVRALADSDISQGQIDKIENYLTIGTTDFAGKIAASFDPQAIAQAAAKKYGRGAAGWIGTVLDQMTSGEITTTEGMANLGVRVADLVAEATPAKAINVEATWATGAVEGLRNELNKGFNAKPILLYTKADDMSNGGRVQDSSATVRAVPGISWLPNFAGGFADGTTGGTISGVGGPRADNIPAMLSVGEFVVNAAAARRNERLLSAINSGNASDLMADAVSAASGNSGTNIGITVNAAPGMNTDEIVSEVERRLAFSYRKGTR
jgi:hypothetical protein